MLNSWQKHNIYIVFIKRLSSIIIIIDYVYFTHVTDYMLALKILLSYTHVHTPILSSEGMFENCSCDRIAWANLVTSCPQVRTTSHKEK